MTQSLHTAYAIIKNNPKPTLTIRQKGRPDRTQGLSLPVEDNAGNRAAIAKGVAQTVAGLATPSGLVFKAPRIAVLFVHEGGLSQATGAAT